MAWKDRNKTIYVIESNGEVCWEGEDEKTAYEVFNSDMAYDELHVYTYNFLGMLKTRYLIDWR